MAAVHKVLSDMFPSCPIDPLQTTKALWDSNVQKQQQTSSDGFVSHIGAALDRVRALKARGASKAEIKNIPK